MLATVYLVITQWPGAEPVIRRGYKNKADAEARLETLKAHPLEAWITTITCEEN